MSHIQNDRLADDMVDWFTEEELADMAEFDLDLQFQILMDRKNGNELSLDYYQEGSMLRAVYDLKKECQKFSLS